MARKTITEPQSHVEIKVSEIFKYLTGQLHETETLRQHLQSCTECRTELLHLRKELVNEGKQVPDVETLRAWLGGSQETDALIDYRIRESDSVKLRSEDQIANDYRSLLDFLPLVPVEFTTTLVRGAGPIGRTEITFSIQANRKRFISKLTEPIFPKILQHLGMIVEVLPPRQRSHQLRFTSKEKSRITSIKFDYSSKDEVQATYKAYCQHQQDLEAIVRAFSDYNSINISFSPNSFSIAGKDG